jgi:hypothetical protein
MAGVEQYFETVEETMRLKFRGWEADLSHPGEKGGIRERRVRDFLSSVLPKRFGLGTGHIIDSQGGISRQTDIVLYDAMDGIVLPVDDYYSLFPCECVYAAIEVKSVLTTGEDGTIQACVSSTKAVKMLKRNRQDFPAIPSLVFAYKTAWEKNQVEFTIDKFDALGKPYSEGFPDAVFVLSPGFFFTGSGPTGLTADNMSEVTVIRKAPMMGFVAHLTQFLAAKSTSVPNLWPEYVKWQPQDVMASGYRLKGETP